MATVNYTEEFKKEAVKLLLESDLPKAKLASNLGVKYSTLMTWYYKSMQKSPAKSNSIDYKSAWFIFDFKVGIFIIIYYSSILDK